MNPSSELYSNPEQNFIYHTGKAVSRTLLHALPPPNFWAAPPALDYWLAPYGHPHCSGCYPLLDLWVPSPKPLSGVELGRGGIRTQAQEGAAEEGAAEEGPS